VKTAEEILASPDRVICIPYQANISREACLKQQELARNQRRDWNFIGFLESREACLRCEIGKKIKEAGLPGAGTVTGPSKGRPLSCIYHPDRPRHKHYRVCLPCYRSIRRRIASVSREMENASRRVMKICQESIQELRRLIGEV